MTYTWHFNFKFYNHFFKAVTHRVMTRGNTARVLTLINNWASLICNHIILITILRLLNPSHYLPLSLRLKHLISRFSFFFLYISEILTDQDIQKNTMIAGGTYYMYTVTHNLSLRILILYLLLLCLLNPFHIGYLNV